MKKAIILAILLIISFPVFSQAEFEKISVTENIQQDAATRIVVQDASSKELNWILKSTLSSYKTRPSVAYVQTNGVDAFAVLGDPNKPYLTIDAALDALPASGGVIKIGLGDFDSPTLAKIKNGTFFVGSGKPKTNSTTTYIDQFTKPTVTAPTMLVNGTVLKGTFDFSNKNSIVIMNLGVDVGSAWVSAHGGTVLNGLITGQVGGIPNNVGPPQKGIVVDNVSALCNSPAAAVHAILIENTLDARISNISTYYGTHGFVIKSRGTNAFNIDCHGHAGEGMIVKADTYAYCSNVNVDNVYITSIGTFDGGGLMVDGGSGTLSNVNINNVNIEHTTYGITDTATLIQDVSISNASIYKTYGNGVYFNPLSKNIILTNIKQDGTQSGNGIELNSTGVNIKTISNSTAKNCSFNGILLAGGNGNINAVNLRSDNSAIVISGNVYGSNVNGSGTITGTLTLVTGAIGAKTLALGLGASNTVGAGSAVILDNGLTAGSYRAMTGQLNASLGLTYWKFNGTAWVDTGIRINETGTMSAQPGVNSNDVVVMSQLNSITSGSYTPTITAGANLTNATFKSATYTRAGNIITVNVALSLFATATNTLTNFTVTVPVNRAASTITDYYVGDGTYYVNNVFSPGHVVFVSNNLSTVTFTFNSGASVGSSATCVITYQYDLTK